MRHHYPRLTAGLSLITATASLMLLGASIPKAANAVSISATAIGDPNIFAPVDLNSDPTRVDSILQNGDFEIFNNAINPIGQDDTTFWNFDFTQDPNFADFSTSDPLTKALLTIDLETNFSTIDDVVWIPNAPAVIQGQVQGLPVGVITRVTIDLLDFYTSNDILNALTGSEFLYPVPAGPDLTPRVASGFGKIPMTYAADAVLSFAKLELSNDPESTPEPSSILGLLAIGSCGLAWALKRNLQ